MKRLYDQRIAKQRNTARYRRERAAFLAAEPFCRQCEADGIISAATDLDHVVPLHLAPDLFWERSNWQGLCRPCHNKKSKAELDAHYAGKRGVLFDKFNSEIQKSIGEINGN